MKISDLIFNILDTKGVGRVKANTICNAISSCLTNANEVSDCYEQISIALGSYFDRETIQNIFSKKVIVDIKENTPIVFYVSKYQFGFPKSLLEMKTECPPILSCIGNIDLLKRHKIGFCGSREATTKGLDVTQDISQQVSSKNIVVVSGYASGIDQQSHYWALKNNGATIIVLPEGINNFRIKKYLKSVWDWDRVLVLSEYVPNAIWSVNRAMQRNTTIVGLSDVMVLIEAKEKGGSIDAGYKALQMNKVLFAPVYDGMPIEASGNSILLQKGALPLRKKRDTGLANLDFMFKLINDGGGNRQRGLFDNLDDL